MGAFGLKSTHTNYCGIGDSTLARLCVKIIPWILTSCLQIYYITEIYRELKRRAVTLSEWQSIGRLLLFPISVIVIYLFGFLNFILEYYDPDQSALMMILVIVKNILTGNMILSRHARVHQLHAIRI